MTVLGPSTDEWKVSALDLSQIQKSSKSKRILYYSKGFFRVFGKIRSSDRIGHDNEKDFDFNFKKIKCLRTAKDDSSPFPSRRKTRTKTMKRVLRSRRRRRVSTSKGVSAELTTTTTGLGCATAPSSRLIALPESVDSEYRRKSASKTKGAFHRQSLRSLYRTVLFESFNSCANHVYYYI